MDKRKERIAAAIDIGSSGVRMHISQWDGHAIAKLDRLEKPIYMGQEVFTAGYISPETLRDLSNILSGFTTVAKGYQISRIYAIATTALREAVNQAYVLDYLSIQNKLDVQVLEDSEANALLFNAMQNSCYPSWEKAMLVFGGAGTINFALLEKGKIAFTHAISTGLLKIAKMMREAADYSRHIDLAAEEYLCTFLTNGHSAQKMLQAEGIIFATRNMRPLYQVFRDFIKPGGQDMVLLPRKTLLSVYEQYRPLSVEQISTRHKLSLAQAGILSATLTFLAVLVQMTEIEEIYCTQVSLADAMLNLHLQPKARRAYNDSLRAGTITSAVDLAQRYHCDLKHSQHVTDLALTLFEKLRKVHGLSQKQSLLLQIACILHETGHYTTVADTKEASYDLVKDAQIYGLRAHETLLCANIISPQNLLGVTTGAWQNYLLAEDDVLFINKMHAILRLADSLDYSRKHKAKLYGVEQSDDHLTLTLTVQEDYSLEQWMFRHSSVLFQEVFGIIPRIKIKSTSGTEVII